MLLLVKSKFDVAGGIVLFFGREGPRSRSYRRTAALRLIVQPCDEDQYFFIFTSNGAPVE
jgi:hypothetical protein